jgi:hypothetical protein
VTYPTVTLTLILGYELELIVTYPTVTLTLILEYELDSNESISYPKISVKVTVGYVTMSLTHALK